MKIPAYKDIIDLIKKGATFEAQEKIMALREAALELQEENFRLKEQLQGLREKLKTSEKGFFDKGLYWIQPDTDVDPVGPFCQ